VFSLRRLLASVVALLLVVSVLFIATLGVWPPAYTVISGSMSPHVNTSDVVVVMDKNRVTPPDSRSGVVSARNGKEDGFETLGGPGNVLVYRPHGNESAIPVLHRARFWVSAGENWYDEGDPAYLAGADDCAELRNCPAPHAGFITKGDANGYYDQAVGISSPVRPNWILGVAVARVPKLGELSPSLAHSSRSSATLSSFPPPQTVDSRVSAYRMPSRSVSTSCRTSYVAGSYRVPMRSPASTVSPSS
jgi:signal peptidase I